MQTFAFRGEGHDAERVSLRIRRMLEARDALCVGELSQRLGVAEAVVRDELDGLIERGEVQRLRPWNFSGDDLDFFRLCARRKPGAPDARTCVRLAGEAMACV